MLSRPDLSATSAFSRWVRRMARGIIFLMDRSDIGGGVAGIVWLQVLEAWLIETHKMPRKWKVSECTVSINVNSD